MAVSQTSYLYRRCVLCMPEVMCMQVAYIASNVHACMSEMHDHRLCSLLCLLLPVPFRLA